MTSKSVRTVASRRGTVVDRRFIALQLINPEIDHPSHSLSGYRVAHTAGLRLLRLAARVGAVRGRPAVQPCYGAVGAATETDETLDLTGQDVGTPIVHLRPPRGAAFFGPVTSRLPGEDQTGPLWDHVLGLGEFSGSLRERPRPARLGVDPGSAVIEEDRTAGSRRLEVAR